MRFFLLSVLLAVLALPGGAQTFVDPLWPVNNGDTTWRKSLATFASLVPAADQIFRISVSPWTEAQFLADEIGTFKRGQNLVFSILMGDKSSMLWADRKDCHEEAKGPNWQRNIYWMESDGTTLYKIDSTIWTEGAS